MITIPSLSFFMLEEINMRVRHIGNNLAQNVHRISFALRVVTLSFTHFCCEKRIAPSNFLLISPLFVYWGKCRVTQRTDCKVRWKRYKKRIFSSRTQGENVFLWSRAFSVPFFPSSDTGQGQFILYFQSKMFARFKFRVIVGDSRKTCEH